MFIPLIIPGDIAKEAPLGVAAVYCAAQAILLASAVVLSVAGYQEIGLPGVALGLAVFLFALVG